MDKSVRSDEVAERRAFLKSAGGVAVAAPAVALLLSGVTVPAAAGRPYDKPKPPAPKPQPPR
jgi:hypothetical protein